MALPTPWWLILASFYALLIGLLVATDYKDIIRHSGGGGFYALLIGLLVATAGRSGPSRKRRSRFYALLIGLLVATLPSVRSERAGTFLCPLDRAGRSDVTITEEQAKDVFLCPLDRAARSDIVVAVSVVGRRNEITNAL